MKRILTVVLMVLLMCAGALCAYGTTVTSVTKIVGPDGQPFTGTLTLQLPFAGVNSSTNQLILATPVVASVINGIITQPFAVTGNDVMSPAMPYSALYTDVSGNPVTRQLYYITGATFDVGSAPATPNFLNSTITFANNITATGNVSVGGTLGVTGATTTTSLNGVVTAKGYVSLALACAALPVGGTLELAPNTNYSGQCVLTGNAYVHCQNQATTVVTAPSGAAVFSVTGTFNQVKIDGCTFIGNGAGSKVIDFTGLTASEGRIIFDNDVFSTFPNDVLIFPASAYMVSIEHSRFVNNSGGITYTGAASDSWIRDNFFENTSGTGSPLTIIGPNVHVVGNTFVRGSGNTTGPDILINAIDNTASNAAYIWIEDNKFGNDGGESATRFKIQANNATTSNAVGRVVIRGNNFFSTSGQSIIRIDNCIRSWEISGNYVANAGVTGIFVDDNFPVCNASWGESKLINNSSDTTVVPPQLFHNGGRGFSEVSGNFNDRDAHRRVYRMAHEAPGLRNRVPHSDVMNATWVASSVTVTTGIADPVGGTRANQLSSATSGNISVGISNTSMTDHFVATVWMQAGTDTSNVRWGIKDNTAPAAFNMLDPVVLNTTWQPYKIEVWGVKPGDSFSLFFFVDAALNYNVYLPCVNDDGGDCLMNTTTAGVSDATIGSRDELYHLFGNLGGFKAESTTTGTFTAQFDSSTGKFSTLNSESVAGEGVAAVRGVQTFTAQTADHAAASIVASATAGEYRVCATARTSSSGTGTTSTLNILWTDEGGAKTDAVGTWALNSVTVTGQINKCEFIHAAATSAIQCSTSGGTYGTSQYALSCTAERIN